MTDLSIESKKNFPHLCDKELCTGCLACYNICQHQAIQLYTDEEGFVFPVVDAESCVNCRMCEKTCPILGEKFKNPVSDTSFAAWAKNDAILNSSSSGGLYSILSHFILNSNGVVFGAAFDEEWNLRHIATQTEEEHSKTKGSKYVQSFIGTTYRDVREYLLKGRYVLFSGTPCQISGLKSYLSRTQCNTEKLYTIDLVCHGVPSPDIFKSYIQYLAERYGEQIKKFSFRDKKWSWLRFNLKASFGKGKTYFGKWEDDPYMRGFLREYFLRKSCHHCSYATEQRCGDFTLCDYWGYYKKNDEVDNGDWGVSLVITNTLKAKKLYQQVQNNIVSYERNINEAMSSNQAFHQCFQQSSLREEFWKDLREKGFAGVINEYLYPEEVNPQFIRVYKYGRIGAKFIGKLTPYKYRLINFLRKIKNIMRKCVR